MRDGILLLNKPTGLSSAKAVAIAKHLLATKKAGHGGTLDPMARGLLLMLSGRATAFARFVLGGKKEYAALIRFGEQTDTDDGEGNIVYRAAVPPNLAESLSLALPAFIGEKEQTAPAHSALKHAGKPLYYYARRGLPAPLKKRTTTVHHLSVIRAGKKTAKLKIVCGGGFYVRSLARDLGEQLGCGAHLHALKRRAVGHFDLSDAILPDALSQESPSQRLSRLLPVSALVSHLPVCRLSAKEIFFLACGGAGDSPADGFWQIFSPHGRFAGVAQAEKERLRALVFLPWTREKGGLANA